MTTDFHARWHSSDLASALTTLEQIRAFDEFWIAWVAFAPGGRAHASAAALEHLQPGGSAGLAEHLVRVAEDLSRGQETGWAGPLPSWGRYALRVRCLATAFGPVRLVTLQPAPPPSHVDAEPASLDTLTVREQQIARLIATGESCKRIAGTLGISEHTVRHHTERVFAKLNVQSRAAVAAIVVRAGRQVDRFAERATPDAMGTSVLPVGRWEDRPIAG